MLLELKVQNLAIIESVEIKFGPGLNVLTGETGAGKSVLLAALNLVLGERSDRELIRTGKLEAWAEAVFEMDERAVPLLKNFGITFHPEEPIALRRVIQNNGRSRAYINCMSVPANILKQMATYLLDFGHQHEQSILLNPEKHLELLDKYGNLEKQREAMEKAYQYVRSMYKEYEDLHTHVKDREERMEFLSFQRKAISDVDPQESEEEELSGELKKMSTIEECRRMAQRIESELQSGADSVRERLARAISSLKELVNRDKSLKHVSDDLDNALISVEEAGRTLQTYRQNLRLDTGKMKEIQERLDEVIKLQNRYGGSYESVMEKLSEIDQEIKDLKNQEKRYKELKSLIEEGKNSLLQLAAPLSEKRHEVALNLALQIQKELADLAMKEAKFEVRFSPVQPEEGAIPCSGKDNQNKICQIGSCGLEHASFMLSANPGEEMRPLEIVASGGELSRILLALKHVLARVSMVQTFVFDEIDAGVSGNAAFLIAQKLRHIATGSGSNCQVICISHTPQIAAEADQHFHVQKQIANERTTTIVRSMSKDERVYELARMLAGDSPMEQAIELAKGMLKIGN